MTLWRIFFAALVIGFFPVSLTIGEELIIDKDIVEIDDPQVNLSDFESKKAPTGKATMIAACSTEVCN